MEFWTKITYSYSMEFVLNLRLEKTLPEMFEGPLRTSSPADFKNDSFRGLESTPGTKTKQIKI